MLKQVSQKHLISIHFDLVKLIVRKMLCSYSIFGSKALLCANIQTRYILFSTCIQYEEAITLLSHLNHISSTSQNRKIHEKHTSVHDTVTHQFLTNMSARLVHACCFAKATCTSIDPSRATPLINHSWDECEHTLILRIIIYNKPQLIAKYFAIL